MNENGDVVFKRNSLIIGKMEMNWPSARNWCLAHKKKLIDITNNRLDCHRVNHPDEGILLNPLWRGEWEDPTEWFKVGHMGVQNCLFRVVDEKDSRGVHYPRGIISIPLQGLASFLDVGRDSRFWTNSVAGGANVWTIGIFKIRTNHLGNIFSRNYPLCEDQ